MKYIIDKVLYQGYKVLFDYNVLLAADMAILALNYGSAVQAILFLTLWLVAQANFFLKIARKHAELQENALLPR